MSMIQEVSQTILMHTGEVIFKQGEMPEFVYLLTEGAVNVSTRVELDHWYAYLEQDQSVQCCLTKTYEYRMYTVYRGGIFGHEELLQTDQFIRRSSAKATTQAKAIKIPKLDFHKYFQGETWKKLEKTAHPIDIQFLKTKIQKILADEKLTKTVLS